MPPDGRPIFVWSPAVGWQDAEGNPATTASGAELGQPNPQTAPQQILELPEESLFVLKDFGCYLQSRTFAYFDIVLAWLSEIRDVLAHTGRTVVFVGVDFKIPPALQHDVTTIEFKLPNDPAIEKAVRYVGEGHPIDESYMPALVTACRGMTQQQVEDRVALALRKFKRLNGEAARLILNEKAEVIRRTGLLDYRDPPAGGLDLIGGWENVKRHVQLDKPCFGPDAREFGIEFPRGLLLVGISGGGKTQMSLCIASYLSLPLIQLDVGSLMSKWVGESERNMRDAVRLLEGLGSCVLQLDEIEKGFGGVGGDMDGGAAQRSFGIFLKWLSDRSCPVYVIATANNIKRVAGRIHAQGSLRRALRRLFAHTRGTPGDLRDPPAIAQSRARSVQPGRPRQASPRATRAPTSRKSCNSASSWPSTPAPSSASDQPPHRHPRDPAAVEDRPRVGHRGHQVARQSHQAGRQWPRLSTHKQRHRPQAARDRLIPKSRFNNP